MIAETKIKKDETTLRPTLSTGDLATQGTWKRRRPGEKIPKLSGGLIPSFVLKSEI